MTVTSGEAIGTLPAIEGKHWGDLSKNLITADYVVTEDLNVYAYNCTYDEGTVTKAATETEDGEMTYTCQVCGATKTEVIPATGSSTTYTVNFYDGTTLYETMTVTEGDTIGTLPAIDGKHWGDIYKNQITADYVVTEDMNVYSYLCSNYYDAGTVTKEATATEDGEMTYTCQVCGAVYTEVIPATGSTTYTVNFYDGTTLVETMTVAADEAIGTLPTIEGKHWGDLDKNQITADYVVTGDLNVYAYLCSNYYDAGTVTKEATCTEDGEIVYTCTVCGNTYAETIAATGVHTAGDPVVENSVAATCTQDGSYDSVVYCTVCGKEISRETITVAATDHTAGEPVVENSVAATCEANGSYDSVVYCTECGAEISRVTVAVPATGHNYVASFTWSSDYSAATVTVTCSECGDTQTTAAEATVTSVTTAATTTADGKIVYTATVTIGGTTYTDTQTVTIAATGSDDSTSTDSTSTTDTTSDASSTSSVKTGVEDNVLFYLLAALAAMGIVVVAADRRQKNR